MTARMRVARAYGLDDVRVEEEPIPRLREGDLLVRISVCGVCSSDAMPWYLERKVPAVLGHEPVGTVQEAEAEGFEVGDRVFFHHHVPCLRCRACARGFYTACRRFRESAVEPGAFAEYVRVPAEHARVDTLKVPDELSDEAAIFVEPLACSLRAFGKLAVQPGESVWIQGLGPMGLLNVMLARHFGASPILASDPVPARRAYAEQMGADVALDPAAYDLREAWREHTGGFGPEKVIVGPGSASAVEEALAAAGPGTTILLFTPTPPEAVVRMRPNELYFNEVTITHSYSAGPVETRQALDLLRAHAFDVEPLVTHRFGLDGVGAALRLAREHSDALRAVVYPHATGVRVQAT